MTVERYDSIPVKAIYTAEGYLLDTPVVTRVGIFEYKNEDGSIRRELRLPDEVFAEQSLASYEGKPIIITHEAGKVDKTNVEGEAIGTILSKGFRDGDTVRAKIIIHNTDLMKQSGLKELSLGYSLELDETAGEWNGQPYDAVQKNILINHLALVQEARAGDSARLNIDGKDNKGGKSMARKKRNDGETASVNPVEEYQKRKEERMAALAPETAADNEEDITAVTDGDEEANPLAVQPVPEAKATAEDGEADPVQFVKDRRDRRDADGDPTDIEKAMEVIAHQDEDIDSLLQYIEKLLARQDFDEAETANAQTSDEKTGGEIKEDCGDKLNADSVDSIVKARVELCRLGDKLNLDGLESMSIMAAKKTIINKVAPEMRLDGKSSAYINAAYDIAKDRVAKLKSTAAQRKQMFNGDGKGNPFPVKSSAATARQAMIERRNGGTK